MRVTIGFVYYYLVFMIGMTVLLGLLYFKWPRHIVFKLLDRLKITEMSVFKLIFWVVFVVIAVLLVNSIMTYLAVK